MKVKLLALTLTVTLILSIFGNVVTYAASFEEEDPDEELAIIEEDEINDVDINNLLTNDLRVSARCAIALDGKTKQILYSQNSNEIVPMASTTKILTALVAINYGNLDREVTISKNAASIRGSTVGYIAGEKIKMRELLYGLLFKSGNDAAIAIAEDIGGSVENFSNIMNDYAKSLGLISSHFESPHGLDSGKHYTTAYDLALLTSKAMENDVFRSICGAKTISKDQYNFTREYSNINKILWKIPNANGVKTGYTGQAGKCLVSSVRYEDRDIIIVVLNCSDRWNVTDKIFKYVSANYCFKTNNVKEIINTSEFINLGTLIEDCDFDYGFRGEGSVEVEVFNPVIDLNSGEIVGKVSFSDGNEELLKQSLTCKSKFTKKDYEEKVLE